MAAIDANYSVVWTFPESGAYLILASEQETHTIRATVNDMDFPLYILSVLDEFVYFGSIGEKGLANHDFYRLDDCPTAKGDLAGIIPQAVQFIDEAVNVKNARIVVHCRAGVSRSASIVIAYMLTKAYFPDLKQTMDYVKKVRPCVEPNDGFLSILEYLEKFGLAALDDIAI